jgi:HSP20 family molecular chaperone IbpA
MSGWQPKCIARATEGGMLVEASLPGVKREDINLQIVDGDLLLSGERKEEKSRTCHIPSSFTSITRSARPARSLTGTCLRLGVARRACCVC